MNLIRAILVAFAVLFSSAVVQADSEEEICERKPLLEVATDLLKIVPGLIFVDYWKKEDLEMFLHTFLKAYTPEQMPNTQVTILNAVGAYIVLRPTETVVIENPQRSAIMLISKRKNNECEIAQFYLPKSAFVATVGYMGNLFKEI